MGIADDAITAGVSAVLGGAAAVWGATIGARATRRASADALAGAARQAAEDREAERRQEEASWRQALHYECLQNINLDKERPDGLWPFDLRIMPECIAHAGAFTPEVLQRIIWARTANEEVEELTNTLQRKGAAQQAPVAWQEGMEKLAEVRKRVLGEIREIEKALRDDSAKTPKS